MTVDPSQPRSRGHRCCLLDGSDRDLTGLYAAPWLLPAAVAVQLRGLLAARGFDAARPITVREAADRDGFELSQEAGERPP